MGHWGWSVSDQASPRQLEIDYEPEPADPRAADRLLAEHAPRTFNERERDLIERALFRARLSWPEGPSADLRAWAALGGPGRGGRDYLAEACLRALSGGLDLTDDERVLAAAGLASARPELVERHLGVA